MSWAGSYYTINRHRSFQALKVEKKVEKTLKKYSKSAKMYQKISPHNSLESSKATQ